MPNLLPAVRAVQRRRLHLRQDGFDIGSGLLATAAPDTPAFTVPFTFTETITNTPSTIIFPTSLPVPPPATITVAAPTTSITPLPTFFPSSNAASSSIAHSTTTSSGINSVSPSYASAWASESMTGGAAESTTSGHPVQNTSKAKVPVAVIVVVVLLIVSILVGLGLLFLRRRFIGKRVRRRSNWTSNLNPTPFPPPGEDVEKQMEQVRAANPTSTAAGGMFTSPPLLAAAIAPPPASYNNPASLVAMPVPQPGPSPNGSTGTGFSGFSGALAGAARVDSAPVAIVRCTFVPTLPDELSITAGELVRVLAEYDDGWSLCETASRAQGMVPVECLDTGALPAPLRPMSVRSIGNWRDSKRSSSLAGAGIFPSGRL